MKEYNVRAYRDDCHERAAEILKHCGDVSNKSLIDIGCHNGFFMGKFLEAGGLRALGIEPMHDAYSEARGFGLDVLQNIEDVKESFDICFYLDLHFHSGINYLPWIKENGIKLSFISASGYGKDNNSRMKDALDIIYPSVEKIYQNAYADRAIFKCW